MLARELEAFAQTMHLSSLRLNADDLLSFRLRGLGRVTLQRALGELADQWVMSLAIPISPVEATDRFLRALERANSRAGLAYPLSVGLFHDQLIFSVRIDENSITAAVLENVLRFLIEQTTR